MYLARLIKEVADIPFAVGCFCILASVFMAFRSTVDRSVPVFCVGLLLAALSCCLAMRRYAGELSTMFKMWDDINVDWQLGHDTIVFRIPGMAPLALTFLCAAAKSRKICLYRGSVFCMFAVAASIANTVLLCSFLTILFKRPQWP